MFAPNDPENLLGKGDGEMKSTITTASYLEIRDILKTKISILNRKMEKLDSERERLVLLIDQTAVIDGSATGRRAGRLAKLRRGD